MSKVEDIIAASKLSELMNKKEEDKHGKTVLWILALVGAVAAIISSTLLMLPRPFLCSFGKSILRLLYHFT